MERLLVVKKPLPLPPRKPATNIARIPDAVTVSWGNKLLPVCPGESADSVHGRKIQKFVHQPTDNTILGGQMWYIHPKVTPSEARPVYPPPPPL